MASTSVFFGDILTRSDLPFELAATVGDNVSLVDSISVIVDRA
jgi:hypothetical protein